MSALGKLRRSVESLRERQLWAVSCLTNIEIDRQHRQHRQPTAQSPLADDADDQSRP